MDITFFSFLMAMLWCNVYIIILALIRRRNRFIIYFSVIPIVCLVLVCVFRLLFSIEFSWVTIIRSETIYPAILDVLKTPLIIFENDVRVCIYHVLIIIWFVGFIYLLCRYVRQIILFNKSYAALPMTNEPKILSYMDEIANNQVRNIRIIQSDKIITPMVTGFFRPTIYLPDIDSTSVDIKNMLLHEWTHFIHKDSWIKSFMYMISAVFWWNPFIHLLKRDLNHILEVKCDLKITAQMDEESRVHYLDNITKVMSQSIKRKSLQTLPIHSNALVSTKNKTKIEQRFHLVLDYKTNKKQKLFFTLLICGIILITFTTTYGFIIQPRYQLEENTIFITPDSSYLIDNADGSYSLYTDGQYQIDLDIDKINDEPFSSLLIKKRIFERSDYGEDK